MSKKAARAIAASVSFLRTPAHYFAASDAYRLMQAGVFCLWPISTFAAGASLGATLGSVTVADWMSLVTLSFVSGLVALLNRVRKSLEAAATGTLGTDQQLIPWWLFAVCHMAGAMFIGTMAFFVCEWLDLNSYLEALIIALFSWSGAKLADKWADTLSDGLLSRFTAIFANGNKD